ncbi:hypothetical protein KVR01_001142 [Diaporthe batatas]|uniref:uncharacterized protein n=1 Tax=Diaporthe batatas TaxID=748121 RepID=UPI001D054663|nr:uncharacterized protein KVR01_001142 [Diaporthe batatas]KAG8168393.1 hypothetical protein KVR01_001142 [Diaporthe batatas]
MARLFFITLVSQVFGALTSNLHRRQEETRNIQLQVPESVPEGRQIVDASFQSYSIEFSYMLDFAGNASHPNVYSHQMLQNLGDIAGSYPIIRAGGTTQNRNTYVANQSEALIARFSTPGADQPASLTVGPAWFESFQQFPEGTKYIYGLNFYDGEEGMAQAVLQAGAAYRGIDKDLYAFEIGNEVNSWPGGSRRPANYTTKSYVDQWTEFADAIGKDALGEDDAKLQPLFQGCAFTAPRDIDPGNNSVWNVQSVLELGLARSGRLKTVADHDYMGANCEGSKIPTIKDNILNHHRMTSLMWYHEALGNFSASQGMPYVLGETNSISCQGTPGVSDAFASALWAVDYVLYVATLRISRLHFHMGTAYRYSPWQPITVNGTAPFAKPLYYGNLFTASALSGGNKQVQILLNETSLTAYAVFDAGSSGSDIATAQGSASVQQKLTSLVLLNLNIYNSTFTTPRPYTSFDFTLPAGAGNVSIRSSDVQVYRLTAPGVEVASNVTFAGQYVDNSSGVLIGERAVEEVEDLGNGEARVRVGDGEALLITF